MLFVPFQFLLLTKTNEYKVYKPIQCIFLYSILSVLIKMVCTLTLNRKATPCITPTTDLEWP